MKIKPLTKSEALKLASQPGGVFVHLTRFSDDNRRRQFYKLFNEGLVTREPACMGVIYFTKKEDK